MLKRRVKSVDIDLEEFSEDNLLHLQKKFPDESVDTLARYLIARKDDPEAAAEQLLRAKRWRQKHCPILKSQCLEEIKKGKVYVRGVDKEGRPLLVITSRLHNPKERDVHEMLLMTLWFTEIAISRLPQNKTRFTVLLDREGYEHAGDGEFMQLLSEVFQDVYPERLHRAIVYPSGLVYYAMWHGLIKWFMDQRTREKVYPALDLSDVEGVVDRQYIPVSMGGASEYVFDSDDFDDPFQDKTQALSDGEFEEIMTSDDVWREVESISSNDEFVSGPSEYHDSQLVVRGMMEKLLLATVDLIQELLFRLWMYLFPSLSTVDDESYAQAASIEHLSE